MAKSKLSGTAIAAGGFSLLMIAWALQKGDAAKEAESTPPQSVVDRVVRAVSSQDPNTMRQVAGALEREGWRAQADALRKAADATAHLKAAAVVSGDLGKSSPASRSQTRAPASRRAPTEPLPDSPLPGIIDPAVSPPSHEDPLRELAVVMIEELLRSKPGGENRAVVAAYQGAHPALRASGLYGPGTALSLLRWQLVPPRPRVWPKRGRVKSRNNYRRLLLSWAQRDPQRADEWQRAALV